MHEKPMTALITGASRGIGRAVAEAFAKRGAHIIVHYSREAQAAHELLARLPGDGHACFQANLENRREVATLAEKSIEAMGRVDILVNNAGVYHHHPILQVDFDSWDSAWQHTLGVNLLGPAHLSFLLGRHMADHGGGRIVNISSRGAFRGEPGAPAYGASKAGMNAMGQSMALALAPHGVFVYTVAPGWVETDMAAPYLDGEDGPSIRHQSPLGRAARPQEIATLVGFLAFEETEYLTGCIIDANGASYLRT
jgi:3-oxoacyl-[acyl-carrier protein] reductase